MDGRSAASPRRSAGGQHVCGALLCSALAFVLVISSASPAAAQTLGTRHKPGPVTLRGVAVHVWPGGFSLNTRTHGSLTVSVGPATRWVEKGLHGKPVLRVGDHVGVRGYVQGHTLTALQVTIYPTKPKAFSLRGRIAAMTSSGLVVSAGGRMVPVRVTSTTVIHIGNRAGTRRDLRVGDQVDIRVRPGPSGNVALLVHVYRRAAAARSVTLHGTLAAVSSAGLVLRSGRSTYHIVLAHSTRIYRGNRHGSVSALAPGQTVTVHACCAGRPLVATSVHIRLTPSSHTTVLYRGTVATVSATHLRLVTLHGPLVISLNARTVYQFGTSPVARARLHSGQRVSVRAYQQGGAWVATRIHIYVTARTARTIVGPVSAVTRTAVVVVDRGRRYTITVTSATRILVNGLAGSLHAIHPGDHVHAVGLLQGTTLTASQITVKRSPPKRQTVRGTIAWIQGNRLVIVDDVGGHHQVRLVSGVQVTLHGKPESVGALFTGARATARGVMQGQVLLASTVTLSLRTKTVRGQVAALGKSSCTVRTSSGTHIHVDLPRGLAVSDPGSPVHPAVLHVGAYVRIQGYVEPNGAVRAFAVAVLHPSVSVSAVIAAAGPTITIKTSKDQQYTLHFAASSQISASRLDLHLQTSDLSVGMRVHVQGSIQSDGTLLVETLVVRLASLTVRGQITALDSQNLTVQVAAGQIHSRLLASTTFVQGSHTLQLTDLVIGDDVTIYGYQLQPGTLLARKVLVHRKVVGMDGTVSSPGSDGFTLNAADGSHRVILSADTVISGGTAGDIVAGAVVHVTGYLRGDGVVLATRVRVGKKG